MLEKSIVFIGGGNQQISSSILGLNSLLHPFNWCFALVPILPNPLIETLEAPLPILVGITMREYRELNLTQDERDSKIWVFLDKSEIIWNKDVLEFPEFDIIDHNLQKEYENFKTSL